jgi:hypothetical protein
MAGPTNNSIIIGAKGGAGKTGLPDLGVQGQGQQAGSLSDMQLSRNGGSSGQSSGPENKRPDRPKDPAAGCGLTALFLVALAAGGGAYFWRLMTTDNVVVNLEKDALSAFKEKQEQLGLLDLAEMQDALKRLKETVPRPPSEMMGSYVSSDEWLHRNKVNKVNAEQLYHQIGVNIMVAADTLREFGAPDEVGRDVANARRNQWSENSFERGVILESPPYATYWDPQRRLAEALERDHKDNSFPELSGGSSQDYMRGKLDWPANWPEYVIKRLEADLEKFGGMMETLRATR